MLKPEIAWHLLGIERLQRDLNRLGAEAVAPKLLEELTRLHAVLECYDAVVNEDMPGEERVVFAHRVHARYKALRDRQGGSDEDEDE